MHWQQQKTAEVRQKRQTAAQPPAAPPAIRLTLVGELPAIPLVIDRRDHQGKVVLA